MNENTKKHIPWLLYVVVPAIPLIAAGNFSLGMNAEVGLFVWEFLALLLWAWVSLSRPIAIKDLLRTPSFVAAALFSSFVMLSVAWSVVFNDALFESLRYFSGFLLFLAIIQAGHSDSNVRRLILLLFFAVALTALYAIYQGVWGFSETLNYAIANNLSADDIRMLRETQRPFATFFHSNAYAGFLAAMIPVSVIAFYSVKNRVLRLVVLSGFVSLITALLFTSSRGGWLCAAIVSPLTALVLLKKRGGRAAAIFILLLAVSGALFLGLQKASQTLPEGEKVNSMGTPLERVEALVAPEDISKSSRITYWQTALRMGIDYQPFGAGLGAYEQLCRQYLTVPTYSRNPHNIWVQFFGELGVVGLVLFLVFLALLLRDGIRDVRIGGDEGETALMLILSAAMLLLHASFDLDMDGPATALTLFVFAGFIVSRRLPESRSAVDSTELILRTVLAAGIVVCVVGLHFINTLAANYSNLADLSAENGSQEKAAEFNAESVGLWPYNPVTLYKQSVLYINLYDKTGRKSLLEKSIETAQQAIEQNPYQAEYYAGLAMLYEKQGEKQKAIATALKSSELYPIGIRYHTLYADMLAHDDKKEEALNVLENALRNADNYIVYKSPDGYDVLEAVFVKASILNELKRFDEALAEYDRMTEYLDRGLVISPFSSSRHIEETVEGIRTRIAGYKEKSRIEKLKLERGVTGDPDPMQYLKEKGIDLR